MLKGKLEIKGDDWATTLVGWIIAANSILFIVAGMIFDLNIEIKVTEKE